MEIKQSQKTDDGSFSSQAGRDLNQVVNIYNGVSEEKVKEICLDLYRKNNDQLSVIAQEKAKIEVEGYAEILFMSLSDGISKEIEDKLKEPEIQAAINDTVKIVARKGKKVDKDYLSELIKEKISNFDDEQQSSIIDDAIEAMEKISLSQLVFFALAHAIRTLSVVWNSCTYDDYEKSNFPLENFGIYPSNINEITTLDERKKIISSFMKKLYISHFDDGYVIKSLNIKSASVIDFELLKIRGLVYDDKSYKIKTADKIKESWGKDDNDDINNTLSKLSKLLSEFGINKIEELDNFVLTPIAAYIGDTYLKSKVKINQ